MAIKITGYARITYKSTSTELNHPPTGAQTTTLRRKRTYIPGCTLDELNAKKTVAVPTNVPACGCDYRNTNIMNTEAKPLCQERPKANCPASSNPDSCEEAKLCGCDKFSCCKEQLREQCSERSLAGVVRNTCRVCPKLSNETCCKEQVREHCSERSLAGVVRNTCRVCPKLSNETCCKAKPRRGYPKDTNKTSCERKSQCKECFHKDPNFGNAISCAPKTRREKCLRKDSKPNPGSKKRRPNSNRDDFELQVQGSRRIERYQCRLKSHKNKKKTYKVIYCNDSRE